MWRTSSQATKAVVQAIVKQYAKRTPKLLEALEEVAQLYERIRHPNKDAIPIDQRIAIDAKDISIFFAMTQNRIYAKALALTTLWRDGDALLRSELEQLI